MNNFKKKIELSKMLEKIEVDGESSENIKLLDEYGNIIDLNNMDYSFSLEFICLVTN